MKSERDQKTYKRASISDHVIPPSPESKPFLNEDLFTDCGPIMTMKHNKPPFFNKYLVYVLCYLATD